jgi:hypothetical protein
MAMAEDDGPIGADAPIVELIAVRLASGRLDRDAVSVRESTMTSVMMITPANRALPYEGSIRDDPSIYFFFPATSE